MKTCFAYLRYWKVVACAVLLSLSGNSLCAATVTWTGATDSSWLNATNWDTGTIPAASDTVILGSGATVSYDRANTTLSLASFTIQSGALISTAGASNGRISPTAFSNAGTIQYNKTSGAWIISLATANGGTATNSGIIESVGNGGTLYFTASNNNVTLNNAGGTLRATGGGTLVMSGTYSASTSGLKITGGNISTDATSKIQVLVSAGSGLANSRATYDGVTITNAGTFEVVHAGFSNTGDRVSQADLIGTTSMTNTGTINITDTASYTNTSNTARMTLGGNASLDNQGTIQIANNATGATTNSTRFEIISATATFTNTGTIHVINNSTAGTPTSTFTSVQSISSSGILNVTGNSSNAGALFEVTGGGNSFTQTAGTTFLSNGGVLSAPSIFINGGVFKGTGTAIGASTIASGGTLSPGNASLGTLTFTGDLTLGGTYAVELDSANLSDLVAVSGTFDISGGTLILNALSGGTLQDGSFTIANYGSLAGGSFATVTNLTGFDFAIDYSGGISNNEIVVTLTAIPEPQTWVMMILGLGVLCFLLRRKQVEVM